MKRIAIVTLALLLLVGCKKDFLEHIPTTEVSYEGFFTSEEQLKLYANGFNSYIPGASVMTADLNSDNIEVGTYNALLAGVRTVPASGGGWNWTWLRTFNILLDNYQKDDEDTNYSSYQQIIFLDYTEVLQ